MNKALIILGDQLFPIEYYSSYKKIPLFMAEDLTLCTHYKYHKHKIIFFLAAMRTYADELKAQGFDVQYEEFGQKTYFDRLQTFLDKNKVSKMIIHEVQDKFFESSLYHFLNTKKIEIEILDSPNFLCSRKQFKLYFPPNKKPLMKSFYEKERKRLNILMDLKGRPIGGEWSYDAENRKKAPKVLTNKVLMKHDYNHHLSHVIELVDYSFSDHPGESKNFWAPLNRAGALKNLHYFIEHHLHDFGSYQDAITPRSPFLYHSILSPMINAGLINPKEIIDEVLLALDKNKNIPLASVEGFIRQVMGWREFIRGIYQNYSEQEESKNFFNHKRKLSHHWYQGTTGLPPVDDAIKKANEYGYCHHIERLMILSNIMLLSELHPHEVHKWFMEMFIDSADWVMGPNVYGMGQFSDGGIFATKPYISGSNYILKMSDYKKGDWCDVWDGLFWRFIENHKAFFSQNPRLSMMVRTLEKMDPVRKKNLFSIAAHFIETRTV
jgi:deoxyribodipyrimidine photolyase-related protein